MIRFNDVHKTYKSGVDALRGVTFRIEDGDFVFIIGKSGSGKSTIMKCITREERPTSGNVTIDGFDISNMTRALVPTLRRQIGMIYQDFRLINTKTVFENIAFAGEIIGIPRKQLQNTVNLVLNSVGLQGKENSYPLELSGGEQQRVAIARAMLNNPSMIVADEPTGNLDPETSENIMALFEQINKSGTTVLICTHDANLVDRMKKRVIEVEAGLIKRDEEGSRYLAKKKEIPAPIVKSANAPAATFSFGDEEVSVVSQENTVSSFKFGDEDDEIYKEDDVEVPKEEIIYEEIPIEELSIIDEKPMVEDVVLNTHEEENIELTNDIAPVLLEDNNVEVTEESSDDSESVEEENIEGNTISDEIHEEEEKLVPENNEDELMFESSVSNESKEHTNKTNDILSFKEDSEFLLEDFRNGEYDIDLDIQEDDDE